MHICRFINIQAQKSTYEIPIKKYSLSFGIEYTDKWTLQSMISNYMQNIVFNTMCYVASCGEIRLLGST